MSSAAVSGGSSVGRVGGGREGIALRRLWRVVPLAAAVAVAVNLLIWFLTETLFVVPEEFMPMDAPPIVTFSVLGVLGATAVFAALVRFTRRPVAIFRWVALVFLLLSLVPNVGMLLDPSAAPFPGATRPAVVALMLMHVVTAAVAVWALTTQTRDR